MKVIAWDKENDKAVTPERFPNNGEWACFDSGNSITKKQYYQPIEMNEKAIRKITIRAFRSRLTLAEKVAIKTSNDPIVQVLDDDLKASSFVDLDEQELINGIDYLVSITLLVPERKAELLANGTQNEV